MADDTNILPNDQNYIRAAGFESSSTAGLVLAGQIDEITGRVLVDNASSGGGLTVGTTTIASGTTTRILYDNAGVLGEYTLSGSGTAVAMATSPTFATSITGSYLTASEILITDGSKNIISAAVATYPSLTELSYVKGVTSAIQTQINAKGAGTVTTVSVATANGFSGTVANATTTPAITIIAGAIIPTSVNGLTISTTTGTLTITNGKTLAVTNTLTLSGTDGTVMTFPTTSATIARTDAGQTFTGVQVMTSPSITTANLSGTQLLAEGASIGLDPAGSADGAWSGITMTGVSGYSQAFGDLVYLSSVDSRWEAVDADSVTTSDRLLGMVVVTGTDGNACTLLMMGTIRADAKFPALTIGSAVYAGEAAGEIQVAIPTGADAVIRRVGYALTADSIYFNPSMDSQTAVA